MLMPQKIAGTGQAAAGQLPYASTDWFRFKGYALSPTLYRAPPAEKGATIME